MAHTFGFRKGELPGLHGRQINLLEKTITLDPGTTKNEDAKLVATTEEVFQFLTEAERGKKPDDFVFTREGGTAIMDMRDAWYEMCEQRVLGTPRLGANESAPETVSIFVPTTKPY